VGIDTNLTMAYQAFALLASILLISILAGFTSKVQIAAARQLPRFGTAGVPLPYRICLQNLNRGTQRSLTLLEAVNDPRPTLAQFLHTPEPYEKNRNWFDRACGYYRWTWLLSRNSAAECAHLNVPALLPRART